ncbi:MAG: FtsH protease activity modulator HflK [Bryobacterales bacterium]
MSVTIPPPAEAAPPPEPHSHHHHEHPPSWRDRLTRRNVAIGLVVLWLLLGLYVVPPEEQAVETVFGAVTDERVPPGVHYNLPWPVGSVYRLKVRQLQRAVIGGEIVDNVIGQRDPIQAQFLTGDQNIIQVRTIAQYSVSEPVDYLFQAVDVGPAVRNVVEAELGRQIASRTVDEVLTTEKVAIQEIVRQRAQALSDRYGFGVSISSVSIEDVSAPPEAADAFRDVASARADAARIVNEAQGYANDIVPRARGEATQSLEAAEGYKERVVNQASGDAARFTALAREHQRNPSVTESRLYLETMEQVLPRLRKTIVDDAGNLDLTIIRRGREKAGALNPAQP